MLKPETVFILGAGASVEFGLPHGSGLASTIARKLDWSWDGLSVATGDPLLFQAVVGSDPERIIEYLAAGALISRGLPLSSSIDDFLYNHGTNAAAVRVGKFAIASSILEAESKSRLAFSSQKDRDNSKQFHGLGDVWLYGLFKRLQTGITIENVDRIFDGVRIINFNYDRCVEQFFYTALQAAYSISNREAADVVSSLDIVHPYGQVGSLPWQQRSGPTIGFGAKPGAAALQDLADRIKTFTERSHAPAEVESWRDRIRSARQLVFLGFGFHSQNLELLDPGPRTMPPWPATFATVLGMSGPDTAIIHRQLNKLRGSPPPNYSAADLLDGVCATWVKNYGLQLANFTP